MKRTSKEFQQAKMFSNPDPKTKKVVEYMEYYAEKHGYILEWQENSLNRDVYVLLRDAIDNDHPRETIKALAESMVVASSAPMMQGCLHPEPGPDLLEEYQRLFNFIDPVLNLRDTKYRRPSGILMDIEYTIESDNEAILRDMPGVQLKLW